MFRVVCGQSCFGTFSSFRKAADYVLELEIDGTDCFNHSEAIYIVKKARDELGEYWQPVVSTHDELAKDILSNSIIDSFDRPITPTDIIELLHERQFRFNSRLENLAN